MISGAPLLVVATSDGVLRFFNFGHINKSLEGVIKPARQLVRALPTLVKAGPGAGLGKILAAMCCDDVWATLSIASARAEAPVGLGTDTPEVDRAAGAGLPNSSSEVRCLLLCQACTTNFSAQVKRSCRTKGGQSPGR